VARESHHRAILIEVPGPAEKRVWRNLAQRVRTLQRIEVNAQLSQLLGSATKFLGVASA